MREGAPGRLVEDGRRLTLKSRQLALDVVDEHVRHVAGISHLLGLLTTVFLAETAAPPAGKHWNESFTVEQRAAVAALPPARATRDDIVAFGLGLAELVITRARPLFPRYDLVWPTELATVVATRLDDCLDVDVRVWLT